ncbi:MAG TPA: benzoate-CoA ligase family protein, partial [Burkholderiales bacterium]
MTELSSADHSVSPPHVNVPRAYNAAHDLLERNRGRSGKTAFIDVGGCITYGELNERVNRAAGALTSLGLKREDRVMLALLDTIDFPVVFLGAIKAGIVPIAANTLLTTADFEFMLRDSRATALVVSEALLPAFLPILPRLPQVKHVIVPGHANAGMHNLTMLLDAAAPEFVPADTSADDPCFWLYSSGSTGTPKGTVHLHSHLILTAELYARPVLGIREDDVVFSAAKLFFAYGLGNGLTFPMSVGATTILFNGRPTPDAVFGVLKKHKPTIFYGVPTLYAGMLASPNLPRRDETALRVCTSAGEALPADIGKRFTEHFGAEILDGIGSTEMLHIFISNRFGDAAPASTGKPVIGYEAKVVGDDMKEKPRGELGKLAVRGPTGCRYLADKRQKDYVRDGWNLTGDTFVEDTEGRFHFIARADDMIVSGGYNIAGPEVEIALLSHAEVAECAVVAAPDDERGQIVAAYVVLRAGVVGDAACVKRLQDHVKAMIAPYKYPRAVNFIVT